ncbi:MAG: hypothetical protein IPG18_16770 [Saprospiraceae bacterium]|nr:hypothetical protein [Saprospiraceae bacterium]
MEDKDLELIEKYVLRILSDEERVAFELKLKTDSVFRAELNDYESAINTFKNSHTIDIKNHLVSLENNIRQKERKYNLRKLILFGTVLLLLLGGFLYKNYMAKSPTAEINVDPMQNNIILPDTSIKNKLLKPDDTLFIKSENSKRKEKKKQTEIEAKKMVNSAEQLFVMNYEPYWDETMLMDVRGQNEGYLEQFFEYYRIKDYRNTLIVFDSLSNILRQNDNILFIKAMALMESGETENPKSIFINIIDHKRSRYIYQSEWYLALLFLKEKNIEKANQLLNKIKIDKQSLYRNKAENLLRKVQLITSESKKNE